MLNDNGQLPIRQWAITHVTTSQSMGMIPSMSELWKDRLLSLIEARQTNMKAASVGAGLGETFARDVLKRDRKPSMEHLDKLARFLGSSASELMLDPSEHKRVPLGQEFDPDPEFDEHPTIGSETGRRGIPTDGIAQIDVTGGMGGGGVSIVNPGVPGKHGMTFAAEHIRDYWRLPVEVLMALGLRAGDIAIIPVQGDSMTATLTEGDFVFVDTRHRLPSPDGIYALTDEFGGVVVKRLEIASSPRDEDVVIRIISDNPKHAPKERPLSDINIMGRVVRRFGVVG